jgi:hypothetical protein
MSMGFARAVAICSICAVAVGEKVQDPFLRVTVMTGMAGHPRKFVL